MRNQKFSWIVAALTAGLLAIGLSAAPAAQADDARPKGVYLNEKSASAGYAFANLDGTGGDLEMYPVALRFGFGLNSWLGLQDHKGTVQFVLEPFVSPITNPESSVAAGVGLLFKYSYPVLDNMSAYVEGGAAPMYFGADTVEQGSGGFEFWDQGGGGLQFFISDNKAVNVGYRYFHISNASTSEPNGGINGHLATVGMSLLY